MRFWMTAVIAFVALLPSAEVLAQTAYEELQDTIRAEVVEIVSEEETLVPGTSASTTMQVVRARLDSGEGTGEVVTFENDFIPLEVGDNIFLSHIRSINGDEFYTLQDVSRHNALLALAVLFVALLIGFAGKQGIRALLSLAFSIGAILFLLVPALLRGYDPVLTSLAIASVILALALFGTHGINPRSGLAFLGTFGAVLATSVIAWVFVGAMRLSGFGSDASVYLNFATSGSLDLSALLLGGIIIGILGILDDVSITQASVVEELKASNAALSARELYAHAIRVGQSHVGSLINTLALAYVGVALPLVLLFATSEASLALTLNREVVAAELARIIVGSIGIILAVPLTTLAAAWWYGTHGVGKRGAGAQGGHHHHHH